MANLEEIVVTLTAETSQLRAQLATATKVTEDSTKKMQDAISNFAEQSSKKTNFFQTAFATMTGFLGSQVVLGALGMVKDGFGAMVTAIEDGIDSANKEENALKSLSTSLALSGNYSATAANDLKNFAGEMENTTGIADDLVLKNLALLSSITKLDSEGLKKAQKGALDLSAAMNVDLETATRMVAKGIEGNTAAFQKMGIEVQKGRNETENFANVMKALGGLNGSAAAQLQTFSGGITAMKNSFGNAIEVLGKVITNNEALKTVIAEVAKIFQALEGWVNKNATTFSEVLTAAIVYTIKGLEILTDVLKVVYNTIAFLVNSTRLLVQGLVDVGQAIVSLAQLDFSGAKNAFKETGDVVNDLADNLTGKTGSAFDAVSDKLNTIATFAEVAGNKQLTAFTESTPAIKNQAQEVDNLKTKFYDLRQAQQDAQDAFAKGLLDEAAAMNSANNMKIEMLKTQNEAELISKQDQLDAEAKLIADNRAAEDALLAQNLQNKLVTQEMYNQQRAVLENKRAQEDIKRENEIHKLKMQGYGQFFDGLSALSSSSNKELASIGKAAAIANATMNAYVAIQNALANVPYPANIAAAAGIGVQAFANIAKISGVGLAKGIDSVPGIGSQDNFPAVLAPGERVVPSETNQDLTKFLQEQRDEPKQQVVQNFYFTGIGAVTREQAVDIWEAIREASRSGATIGGPA
jgi:hypothetical protein